LLGLEAVTLDVPRRYTAIAGSACTVIPLKGAAVFKALRASPMTLSQFLRSNDRDLAEARLISLSSGFSSKARIADVRLVSIGGGADEIMLGIICKMMGTLPGKQRD